MRNYSTMCTLVAAGLVVACSSGKLQEKNAELKQSSLSSDAVGYIMLGQGYDTQRAKSLNIACVTGVKQENRFSQSKFEMDYDLSFQDFLDKIEGKLSAELSLPVVRAGVGAQYAEENSSNSNSNTFLFNWQMIKRSEVILPGTYTLTPDGQSFVNGDKTQLQNRCGDEFVKQVEYGASFFVNMKVDYLNDSDKANIGGKLKLGIGKGGVDVVKLEGELKKIDEKKKESVKISIRARQVGGDPTQLSSILSENLIECTLKNPTPCFNIFDAAMKYAKVGIPTQLASVDAFVPVRYVSENYKESGVDALVPSGGYQNLDALIKIRQQEIESMFKQNLVDYQRASDIVRKYSSYLEDADVEAVFQVKDIAFANATVLGDASLTCFDAPTRCLAYWAKVEKSIKVYDRNLLTLRSSLVDLKPGVIGAWTFGYPKATSAFIKSTVTGDPTLEDRQGIALKSETGELIRVSTYLQETNCSKVSEILSLSSVIDVLTSKDYGIKYSNDTFGDIYSFSFEAAFRSHVANTCLYLSIYPAVPHQKAVDVSQPSEIRTFIRQILESVHNT